jgi:hypothetical protein
MYNEELHNLHSSSNIISDEIRQDGVGEMKIAYKRSI